MTLSVSTSVMNELISEVFNCKRCTTLSLAAIRDIRNPRFGTSCINKKITMIGMCPGYNKSKPADTTTINNFISEYSNLLKTSVIYQFFQPVLQQLNLDFDRDVFFTNLVKCPLDRDPSEAEVDNCNVYLTKQLKLLQPKLVILLGKFVIKHILNIDDSPTYSNGKIITKGSTKYILSVHPSYALYTSYTKMYQTKLKASITEALLWRRLTDFYTI